MKERKLLSKRVQCSSVEAVVDDYCWQFSSHFKLNEQQSTEMRFEILHGVDACPEAAAIRRDR